MFIAANAVWHVSLFGTLQAVDPDGVRPPITHFRTQRSAALLAFLAFHKGQYSREVLAEMLWSGVAPDVGAAASPIVVASVKTSRWLPKCCLLPAFSLPDCPCC